MKTTDNKLKLRDSKKLFNQFILALWEELVICRSLIYGKKTKYFNDYLEGSINK